MTVVALKELKKAIKKDIDKADEKTVLAIRSLLGAQNEGGSWSGVSDGEKRAIKQGLKEVEAGEGIPHEEMKKRYSKWLTK